MTHDLHDDLRRIWKMSLVLAAGMLLSMSDEARAASTFDFESPTYASGSINGQDSWTSSQTDERVLTSTEISAELTAAGLNPATPVHGGDQALLLSGPGGSSSAATIHSISGLSTANTAVLDFWARPLTSGSDGSAIGPNTGNVFIMMEDEQGSSGRATGVRFGPTSIDGYSTNWVASSVSWQPDTWYNVQLVANYLTKEFNLSVDGSLVLSGIPFHAADSPGLNQIRVFRGGSQAGMILDDVSVVPEPATGLLLILSAGAFGLSVVRHRRSR
ncbi:MAG: PEP-CTERM sorting domain-containing protein [Planctomycetales bacterium]|nr:PEP-CTERM sorting domain-containing protein [Planctomycetales bacterium]